MQRLLTLAAGVRRAAMCPKPHSEFDDGGRHGSGLCYSWRTMFRLLWVRQLPFVVALPKTANRRSDLLDVQEVHMLASIGSCAIAD